MTRLIVVRHGYSESNASGRYTGQMDVPLHEIGRAQATLVAKYLAAHEKIDAVYASDLSRAMETAKPTAAHFGLTVTPVPALRELSMGIWEGMLYEDVCKAYGDVLKKREVDYTYPCPGGESFADLYARVRDAVLRLAEQNEGKCILLVSHGGAIRTLRCMAAGDEPKNAQNYPNMPNGAISVYRYEGGALTALAEEITAHLTDSDAAAKPALY